MRVWRKDDKNRLRGEEEEKDESMLREEESLEEGRKQKYTETKIRSERV